MDKLLNDYIKNTIKPMYKTFDKGHNEAHFNFVTQNCLTYGKQLQEKGEDVNLDIAYLVGALHDIGISRGREGHALSSGKMVREDKFLNSYFDKEMVELIAQAVEDHSSHLSYEPRSIYGKIVADADRNNSVYLVFSRPIKYGLKNEKQITTKQGHLDRVYNFVNEKFGRNGYVKYWLDIPDTKKEQNAVWNLLDNKKECYAYMSGLFDEITKGKFKEK